MDGFTRVNKSVWPQATLCFTFLALAFGFHIFNHNHTKQCFASDKYDIAFATPVAQFESVGEHFKELFQALVYGFSLLALASLVTIYASRRSTKSASEFAFYCYLAGSYYIFGWLCFATYQRFKHTG